MTMTARQLEQCRTRLEQYLSDLLEPLGRRERRHWGGVYVRGLLLDGERKSIEPMAARLGDGNVQAMQQFIGQSPWEWEPVWEQLGRRMTEELESEAVWVIDDTGFPKQGRHSVGVARQYSGTLGKTANCQVAVTLHHAGEAGSAVLGWRLYLPESWTGDALRRREAGVPETVTFQEKWKLAVELIDRARAWGLADRVVVADGAYGESTEFRHGLEQRGLSYVVGIPSTVGVWTKPPRVRPRQHRRTGRPTTRVDYGEQRPRRVKEVALAAHPWKTIRWREGTKGKLHSRFWAARLHPSHGYEEGRPPLGERWVLVEWPPEEPEPTRYFLSNLPPGCPLRRLVRLAKSRWKIEQDYQQFKEELGLDHYEGRRWRGWHHHVTLVMLAQGFLTLEQLRHKKNFWVDPPEDTT